MTKAPGALCGAALRIAKLATGGYEVIALGGSWHGTTGASAAASYASDRRGYGPKVPGGHVIPEPNAYRCPVEHCRDLISAFKQDAVKLRYDDWADLMGYCDRSAAPVGRYLLDLHGESREGYPANDALCNALQVLNHLQDCGDDRRSLDRVYIIGDWMAEEGSLIEDIDRQALTPGLRRVVDRMLDGCDALMADARALPSILKSRSLAMESAVIVNLAARLIERLRKGDPLARRVALSKLDFAKAGFGGAVTGFFAAGTKRGAAR